MNNKKKLLLSIAVIGGGIASYFLLKKSGKVNFLREDDALVPEVPFTPTNVKPGVSSLGIADTDIANMTCPQLSAAISDMQTIMQTSRLTAEASNQNTAWLNNAIAYQTANCTKLQTTVEETPVIIDPVIDPHTAGPHTAAGPIKSGVLADETTIPFKTNFGIPIKPMGVQTFAVETPTASDAGPDITNMTCPQLSAAISDMKSMMQTSRFTQEAGAKYNAWLNNANAAYSSKCGSGGSGSGSGSSGTGSGTGTSTATTVKDLIPYILGGMTLGLAFVSLQSPKAKA